MTGKYIDLACKDGNTETEGYEITKAVKKVNGERALLAFLNARTKGHEMKLAQAKFATAV